jgi:hypothetical protein
MVGGAVNICFVSQDFLKPLKAASFAALLSIALATLAVPSQVLAQGTCPAIAVGNASGKTTCAANDIQIAAVRQVGGQPLACQPGTVLEDVFLEIEFELDANGARWDILAGIQTANPTLNPDNATLVLAPGVAGVGPLAGQVGSGECVIASLDVGLDGIIVDNDPAPGDSCGDIPQGGANQNVVQEVGTGVDVLCDVDPVSGGVIIPTIVTWQDGGGTQQNWCDADASNSGWYPTFPLSGTSSDNLESFASAKCRVDDARVAVSIHGSLTIVKATASGDDSFLFDWSTAQGTWQDPNEIVPAAANDVVLSNGQSFEIFPILAASGQAPATNTVTVTEDALAG